MVLAPPRVQTVSLPPLHRSQTLVKDHPARFKVLAAGRRWGKTKLASLLCVATALVGGRAWWVAPTYKTANVGWREIKRLCTQIPGTHAREADRHIDFPGGGWVEVRSADTVGSLRGEGLDLVVCDEAAYMREDAWTEELRPALADRRGKAIFISTPNGRNWFWQLWMRGENPDYPDWASWQLPTTDNPFIDRSEVEEARRESTEEVYEQEFMAQFMESGLGIFRNARTLATLDPHFEPEYGHEYVFGADWGKVRDFTAFSVWDITARKQVWLDRFNQIEYSVQIGRLLILCRRYRPLLIVAEQNNIGAPIIEALHRKGLPVFPWVATNASKAAIIEAYGLGFDKKDFTMLRDSVQLAEHQAFTGFKTASGMIRYAAPGTMHDDTVIAGALAYQAMIAPRETSTQLKFGPSR